MEKAKEEALAAIAKAEAAVKRLCNGEERWTMRIPANEERDHDLIIGKALHLAAQAIREPESPIPQPAPTWTSEVPTEPVAWGIFNGDEFVGSCRGRAAAESAARLNGKMCPGNHYQVLPLYVAPPPLPAPQAEGVAAGPQPQEGGAGA